MYSTSTTNITYCVPSTPCANTDCNRHRAKAPINMAGISVSDYWGMCAEKLEYKLLYPVYSGSLSQ